MLDVTVCILSYNRSAYLQEAIASVLEQTKKPKKIVIYDNGSNEDVFNSVEEFLKNGVEWIGAEINHPFIWNFDRAMFDGKTEYIMMFHDDDRLCPNFLETQIGLMEADASLVAVSCNGYFIGETGERTGGTLAPAFVNEAIEKYACSGQVALKYASDSCIPFSPTIYRRQSVCSIKFREEFGKVCDAVYFCDLAEIGAIAYQRLPLYECRVHVGQDSNHFPYDLMNRLENFFESRKCLNQADNAKLKNLLVGQHTARNIKRGIQAVKNGDFYLLPSILCDDKFRITIAIKTIGAWCLKYWIHIWKNKLHLVSLNPLSIWRK